MQRAGNVLRAAVIANRLRNRQNVRLGERAVQRRAAMPARAEADELVCVARVGRALVVIAFEPRQIHEQIFRRGFSSER